MIDAAFWASLRREEGYSPLISLAFVSPEQAVSPLRFERSLLLGSKALTKLAPAVERPGIHLGVWPEGDELRVWGATRHLPPLCFVLEVFAPGLLAIKRSRSQASGKYVNIAVIQGDEVKILDERAATEPDCPNLLTSLLGFNPEERSDRTWQDVVTKEVDGIAGLTAVDGATLITDSYDLLAFGAKIIRRSGWAQVSQVILTEPVEDATPMIADPAQIGGTRHLSAAQFVHDQRDAMAMVASQDGRFTVFAWSTCDEMVHAHRIDALLM